MFLSLLMKQLYEWGIQAREMQESGWEPRWFARDKSSGTYRYVGGYWEARVLGNWNSCRNIFCQISSDHLSDEG